MMCAACSAAIPAFLDGTLSGPDREHLVSHVQICETCRVHVHHALNARGYISCRDVVDLVTAYLEDALAQDERARFEQHLAICPPCGVYLDQMRQTIRALGTLSEEVLSDQVQLQLLMAFRDWTRTEPSAAPPPHQ